jgi:hypothetical protein
MGGMAGNPNRGTTSSGETAAAQPLRASKNKRMTAKPKGCLQNEQGLFHKGGNQSSQRLISCLDRGSAAMYRKYNQTAKRVTKLLTEVNNPNKRGK